jgi:hypothetical protein
MMGPTLRKEINSILEEYIVDTTGNSYALRDIMKAINKRSNKIDVGEMIKSLMWQNKGKGSLNYGDISSYIEKNIVKEMK